MQFPEKIVSIKPGDKVLDIGPGGNPHPKATVYLELNLSEQELAAQRGYAKKPQLPGEVIYYDGKRFPFKDNEFDLSEGVICKGVVQTKRGNDNIYSCKIKTNDWFERLRARLPNQFEDELKQAGEAYERKEAI